MTQQMTSIYDYITNHLFNEPATYRLQSIIEQKFSTISTFPNSGTPITSYIDDVSKEFSNIRKLNANNYSILYHHKEVIDIAFITHIFHQSQNYGVVFQK